MGAGTKAGINPVDMETSNDNKEKGVRNEE